MQSKEQILLELQKQAEQCRKCRLAGTRSKVVFGEGNPGAEVMFIGEGPGKQEDLTGRPFVGRAGELLTRIIERGMGIPRSSVYIANLVKCRPTVDMKKLRDRPPDPEEIATCTPYLMEQIRIIQPKVIVALGSPSAKFLLNTAVGITRLRGTWGEWDGIPVMPTYHPSYLLRNGDESSPLKRDVWNDIKKVLEKLGRPIPLKQKGGNK
jgi:DNA polymerase